MSWAVSVFTCFLPQGTGGHKVCPWLHFLDISRVSVHPARAMKCYWQVVDQEGGDFNKLFFNALCLEVSGGAT